MRNEGVESQRLTRVVNKGFRGSQGYVLCFDGIVIFLLLLINSLLV
jgi:hypothetical protein